MDNVEGERTTVGWAARDTSGILSPYTFTLKIHTGQYDGHIKVHMHEVAGEVIAVGSNVTKFKVGDAVGVGLVMGSCRKCGVCKCAIEQYCSKKIWTCSNVYTDGRLTQGGFAEAMVVDQNSAVKVPEGMAPEQVAPLMCAGVTVYSPLSHFGLKRLRGGILELGGVGHMGVKIAKAMGRHVTVISSSEKKKQEVLEHLGADDYVVGSDESQMQKIADSLDYIIDTVPVAHPLEPYISLLKVDGKLILTGAISTPLQFLSPTVMLGRNMITGTFIGSIKEMEETLEFWKEKGLSSMIEVVKMDYINKAFGRLEKNDVGSLFTLLATKLMSLSETPAIMYFSRNTLNNL